MDGGIFTIILKRFLMHTASLTRKKECSLENQNYWKQED
jgi:hypothetical protein